MGLPYKKYTPTSNKTPAYIFSVPEGLRLAYAAKLPLRHRSISPRRNPSGPADRAAIRRFNNRPTEKNLAHTQASRWTPWALGPRHVPPRHFAASLIPAP